MKFARGIVSISMLIGLVVMAVALPVAGKLALNNQDNRNRAAGTTATCSGVSNSTECAYIPGCNWSGSSCLGSYPTPKIVGCTMDSQCASGSRCVNGYCKKTSCVMDADCTGGYRCVSGSCKKPSCIMDSDCGGNGSVCNSRTGVCEQRLIPTSVEGKSCAGIVGATCGVGFYCKNWKCVPSLPNGTGCVFDGDCLSGACTGRWPNKKCVVVTNKVTPTSNRKATPTQIVKKSKLPNGSRCWRSSACASGSCVNRRCI